MNETQNIETTSKENIKPTKAFTRSGDRGKSLIGYYNDENGNKVPIFVDKDSLQICLGGEIDELSSWIGQIENNSFKTIQVALYKIGGYLYSKEIDQDFVKKEIGRMERFCEKYSDQLPTEFVLPQGKTHYARALTRKVERTLVNYAKTSSLEGVWLLEKYFNRLSSYFYVYATAAIDIDL